MKNWKEFELKKAWQWLLYLYLILPGLLFGVAYITRGLQMGSLFGRLWHSYNLYIVNPVPHLPSMTGLMGVLIAAVALVQCLRRRDKRDLLFCAVLITLNAAWFLSGGNYLPVSMVRFV